MPAVVAGEADGADIFLDGGADDVACGAMEAEVDDLDAVADELQVDGLDRAVVPVANRDGGQEAEGRPGLGSAHGATHVHAFGRSLLHRSSGGNEAGAIAVHVPFP